MPIFKGYKCIAFHLFMQVCVGPHILVIFLAFKITCNNEVRLNEDIISDSTRLYTDLCEILRKIYIPFLSEYQKLLNPKYDHNGCRYYDIYDYEIAIKFYMVGYRSFVETKFLFDSIDKKIADKVYILESIDLNNYEEVKYLLLQLKKKCD
ncbi:hypothetical protein EDEG_00417 [Edhazardia aedis USNM 41457]|uniref:Uncharacterized protein n=1 Tax=Edhazardia aedis (strain USNM 41457) TaxID=1003232 RepID=J9DG59_EDHAE|nr:hypothetical protein EDEG_00417 [Edhazardia aedis USNM 41457]|eukprot:EJW01565.1 hypothetical protein EDEG_00417 [Edhazardia aedis USNM 41457]